VAVLLPELKRYITNKDLAPGKIRDSPNPTGAAVAHCQHKGDRNMLTIGRCDVVN